MFKALLCIPPNYCFTYDFPPLGTPMLSGYLKERGIEVIQVDYNIGYLDYWKRKVLRNGVLESLSTSESAGIVRELLNRVFQQKYKGNHYSSFFSSEFIGTDYHDYTNSAFSFVERLLSSEQLFKYIEDVKENTFLKYFLEEDVISEIEQQGVDLVGISITAPAQVIGAFTLGNLIKKNLDNVHVTIGGQWVSLYREELKKRPHWDRFFDSIIVFEGETPLHHLIVNICKGGSLASVPNLIYKEDSKWVQSRISSKEDMNQLACPDFDGLPLRTYTSSEWTGGVSLTYQTARECYWNKCIYCVDLPFPKQGYRERDTDLIIDDFKKLIKKYKMSYLEISNATMSPQQLRRLSERIIQEGWNFSWWCFVRLEERFTKDLFELAKRAGCQDIGFGFESGSQRVLDFVNKGINLDTAKRAIVDCHKTGIRVNLQVMIGLPSETINEALDTIKFLIEYRDYISTLAFNIYYVTPACEVYLRPSQYGINYRIYPDIPFKFFHEYSHVTGELPVKKAGEFISLYYELLHKKKDKKKDKDQPTLSNFVFKHNLFLTVGDDSTSLEYHFNKETKEGFILNTVEAKEDVRF
jgi:radical SAM superfamily enzyme YgiQ (UPF0313 family)